MNDKLLGYLGAVDEDLSEFIMENLQERRSPQEMADGLEPVSPDPRDIKLKVSGASRRFYPIGHAAVETNGV